jgi:hypothetical protein
MEKTSASEIFIILCVDKDMSDRIIVRESVDYAVIVYIYF